MALPTILFNSSGSSDTAASGAGPATALFGTAAALASSTTVTLSVDGPTLTGVAVDGSAAIWVDSSSGRQWSRITAIDNTLKTVTVATAFTVTESGRSWGIGGKRATFDNANSRKVFVDIEAGWIIQTEVNQNITTSAITVSAAVAFTIKGDSAAGMRTLSTNANAAFFSLTAASTIDFQNLAFENTNGTKTAADGITTSGNSVIKARNCRFGHATNTLRSGIRRTAGGATIRLLDCEVLSCTDVGVHGRGLMIFESCSIHNNTSHGAWCDGAGSMDFGACTVYANGGDGARLDSTCVLGSVKRCTFHGNTGDGIDTTTAAGNILNAIIHSNNFTGNGGAGINAAANSSPTLLDHNNFGTGATANTGGALLNLTAGANDLAVDPAYTSTATGDFSAGTSIKALGFPSSARKLGGNPATGTTDYVDIGIQRQEPSSSGGVVSPAAIVGVEGVRIG